MVGTSLAAAVCETIFFLLSPVLTELFVVLTQVLQLS